MDQFENLANLTYLYSFTQFIFMDIPAVISGSSCVLVVWHAQNDPENVKVFVKTIQARLDPNGKIQVENADRLIICE